MSGKARTGGEERAFPCASPFPLIIVYLHHMIVIYYNICFYINVTTNLISIHLILYILYYSKSIIYYIIYHSIYNITDSITYSII